MDDSTPTRSIRLPHARTCLGGEAYPRAPLAGHSRSGIAPSIPLDVPSGKTTHSSRGGDARPPRGRCRPTRIGINKRSRILGFRMQERRDTRSGERGNTHPPASMRLHRRRRAYLCFFTLLRTTNSARNPVNLDRRPGERLQRFLNRHLHPYYCNASARRA